MKTFQTATLNALASEQACIFTFCTIELPLVTKRYSDSDIKLYYDGNLYSPHPIDLNLPSFSSEMDVDTAQLTISDIDLSFRYEAQASDILKSPITLSIAVFDSWQIQAVDTLAIGFLNSWEIVDNEAQIMMCNIFRSWHKRTLRKTRSSCQWYWKSAECGYTGESTTPCNQTYAQCQSYGNDANYGGFRFVDILQDVPIYWGRNPD